MRVFWINWRKRICNISVGIIFLVVLTNPSMKTFREAMGDVSIESGMGVTRLANYFGQHQTQKGKFCSGFYN